MPKFHRGAVSASAFRAAFCFDGEQSNGTRPSVNGRPTSSSSSPAEYLLALYAACAIVSPFSVLVIAGVICLLSKARSRRRKKREKQRLNETHGARRSAASTADFMQDVVERYDAFKRKSSDWILSSDVSKAAAVLKSLAKLDSNVTARELARLDGACHPEIMIRKDTQVSTDYSPPEGSSIPEAFLHMNRFADLVNLPILLGQPAGAKQAYEYCQTFRMHSVNVVVWIGNEKEGDPLYAKPYLDFERGETTVEVAKDEKNRVTFEVLSRVRNRPGFFDVTEIRLLQSEILVVHVDSWRDANSSAFVSKLVDAFVTIHAAMFKGQDYWDLDRNYRDYLTRAMAVHCPTGVERAVTFVALYLCRQLWLRDGRVNVNAVLEQVGKHRYKSRSPYSPKQALSEMQLIYAVMDMIVERDREAATTDMKRRALVPQKPTPVLTKAVLSQRYVPVLESTTKDATSQQSSQSSLQPKGSSRPIGSSSLTSLKRSVAKSSVTRSRSRTKSIASEKSRLRKSYI